MSYYLRKVYTLFLLIPWDETNQLHRLVFTIEGQSQTELSRVETDIEVGRPPGLPPEAEQRVMLALTVDLAFPEQGDYRVVAEADEDRRSVGFRVYDLPRPNF